MEYDREPEEQQRAVCTLLLYPALLINAQIIEMIPIENILQTYL